MDVLNPTFRELTHLEFLDVGNLSNIWNIWNIWNIDFPEIMEMEIE